MVPLLLGISVLSFFVQNLAPGDFLTQRMLDPSTPPEVIEQLRSQFGLDLPLHMQYFKWLSRVIRLDFGYSFTWGVPVSWLLKTRLFNTFILSLASMIIAWAIAIPVGIHAAVNKYSWSDNVLTVFTFIGLSLPTFFLLLLVLYFIATTQFLGLPIGGMTSIEYDFLSPWGKFVDILKHLAVPALVLGIGSAASLMRQMRGNLLEVLRQDYIRTAQAKGLSNKVVIYKHALRNAINPLITIFGYQLGGLLGGAAITEIVTAWPGMGQMMLEALTSQDIYLVMGNLMLASVMLMLGNLIADILLALTDPRIRYS